MLLLVLSSPVHSMPSKKLNSCRYFAGGGTGMAYEDALLFPPFSGISGSLSRLCHPTLVSLEISMQTPFYLILMLISHAFVYITSTKQYFHGGLYGITPKLVAGASMDRSPFRMCSCQTSQTVVDNVSAIRACLSCRPQSPT